MSRPTTKAHRYGLAMSELSPRGGQRLSRRQREKRAYQLVVVGGIAAAVAAVGVVLAFVGLIGFTTPVLAVVVAVVAALMFRSTVSG